MKLSIPAALLVAASTLLSAEAFEIFDSNNVADVSQHLLSQETVTSKNQVYIDSKEQVLRDPEGRQVLFHGVNVVYKVDPYIPTYKADEKFDDQDSLIPFDMENL
jgi:hypothetical protein